VNLQELRWFVALTESENITAVAAEMHVTQPTLSRAIARLETGFGVRLFDRRHNRLHLNRYGEILRAHALRALSEVDSAHNRISTLADPNEGTVSLCFLHSLGEWLVPELISGYRAEHPKVRFELRGAAADSVVDDIRLGRSDLGFVAPEPSVDDLVWTPVATEPVRLLVPVRHRLARRKTVSFAEVAEDDFVALTPEYGLRQLTDRLARAAGFAPRIAFSVTEVGTMRAMIAAGVGVGVVPAPPAVAAPPEGTVLVELRDRDAWRTIGMIRADRPLTSSVAEGFQRFVLETLVENTTGLAGPPRRE
jgi:LysR family transcriptional activator of glutamate synthase operon